ncbi:rhodanese-like protein [Candidatus Thiomargarita nelsonii]|uniref:Rhodanese-like protein n=1 Tax=Candidatus Thiomargarita nelsonii TaxID=1003181 RepID=A0A176RVA2_9GAMM|nr:rhodanese-like protein [Candidatus Thiomargarita nelsonii]
MKRLLKCYQPILVFFICVAILTACGDFLSGNKKTVLGLYLKSTEAYELLKQDVNNNIMFDVRTIAEVKQGSPTLAEAHVPIFLVEQNKVVFNKDFVSTVEEHLKKKGLDKESTILMICRQGNRSAKAVDILAKLGYKKVFNVVDGVHGWKDNNLPLSF